MTAREQQAFQTYENIIVTAEKLLANSSYEELSVNEICEHAGISKGGFYHHFPSKDQLIALLIGRRMGNLLSERIEPLLGKENAFELIKIYMDTTIEFLEKSPKNTLARCWVALSEHAEMTSSPFVQTFFDILYKIVAQGVKENSFRTDLDVKFIYSYINAAFTGIMIQGVTFQNTYPLRDFAANSINLLYETLKTTNTNEKSC